MHMQRPDYFSVQGLARALTMVLLAQRACSFPRTWSDFAAANWFWSLSLCPQIGCHSNVCS